MSNSGTFEINLLSRTFRILKTNFQTKLFNLNNKNTSLIGSSWLFNTVVNFYNKISPKLNPEIFRWCCKFTVWSNYIIFLAYSIIKRTAASFVFSSVQHPNYNLDTFLYQKPILWVMQGPNTTSHKEGCFSIFCLRVPIFPQKKNVRMIYMYINFISFIGQIRPPGFGSISIYFFILRGISSLISDYFQTPITKILWKYHSYKEG